MFRKYLLPLLAVIGFLYAVYSVKTGHEVPPIQPPKVTPSQSPFASFIFGTGIIEANTENISVGAPVSGIVTQVAVKVGARVQAGDPLFRMDDRALRATLAVRKAQLSAARVRLARLVALPRPEEVIIAEARRAEAIAQAAEMEDRRMRVEAMSDQRAVGAEEIAHRAFAEKMARAKVAQAEGDLALLRAGAWAPDFDLAKLEVAQDKATVSETEMAIEGLTVRSPVAGEVLQVNLRAGEFAQNRDVTLILLGHTDPLAVRVDIDEHDAWRFQPGTAATAFVRGNPRIKMPLTFSRAEPMLVPKRSLTGASTERVDTRVLQVIYHFDRGTLPIYVGQQVDVYIATSEAPGEGGEPAQNPGGQP